MSATDGTHNQSCLSLITLRTEHKDSLLFMLQEYQSVGEQRYCTTIEQVQKGFPAYLQWLVNLRLGKGLRKGIVPETVFWMVQGGNHFIGSSRLRHRLTPALTHEGGHIGYDVRPSERGRGFATILLSHTLARATQMGLMRVLLTCDTENIASARVIEKNGGVLEDQLVSSNSGKSISRYWIDVQKRALKT